MARSNTRVPGQIVRPTWESYSHFDQCCQQTNGNCQAWLLFFSSTAWADTRTRGITYRERPSSPSYFTYKQIQLPIRSNQTMLALPPACRTSHSIRHVPFASLTAEYGILRHVFSQKPLKIPSFPFLHNNHYVNYSDRRQRIMIPRSYG